MRLNWMLVGAVASVETFHIVPVMHTKRLGTTQLTTYQRQHSGSLMTTSSPMWPAHFNGTHSLQTLLPLRTESLILCVCTVRSLSPVATANSRGGFCSSVRLPFWCCSVSSRDWSNVTSCFFFFSISFFSLMFWASLPISVWILLSEARAEYEF